VQPFKQFARSLGVAFQILNDLHDWQDDDYNKLMAGGDTLAGRPTVLLALALEALPKDGQDELVSLVCDDPRSTPIRINRVRQLYHDAGVFDQAHRLVDKHQERAQAVADEIDPEPLRRLFYYLIDAVLDRPSEDSSKPVMLVDPADLPVVVQS
jgi:geranylgeranyl pyrophosphate synthase